jgi:hypothetical protein
MACSNKGTPYRALFTEPLRSAAENTPDLTLPARPSDIVPRGNGSFASAGRIMKGFRPQDGIARTCP